MIFARKWGLEPYFAYQSPTLWTVNRRKTQKISRLQIPHPNREQNCSRMCLFANCTRLNLTMFTILPDRGITKIAETVLVSAICGFMPICSVIRLEPLNSDAVSWVSGSYEKPSVVTHAYLTLILQCSSPECNSDITKLINYSQSAIAQRVKNPLVHLRRGRRLMIPYH